MPNGNTKDADKPAYDKPSWTIVHDGWSYANLSESTNLSLKASIIPPPCPPPPVILLLAVQRLLFCFGSLVVLDVVCDYVLLFLLDLKIENR